MRGFACVGGKLTIIANFFKQEDDSGASDDDDASSEDEASDDDARADNDEPSTPRKRKRPNPARTPSAKSKKAKPSKAQRQKKKVVPKMTTASKQRAHSRAAKRSAFRRKQQAAEASGLPPAPTFAETEVFRRLGPFEQAKALLHVSATPEVLPCRDTQRNLIKDLLGDAVLGQTGTCIYIHGVPGTGKTATVHSVVRELQQDDEMDAFQFVEINGMKIADPTTAFSLLWEHLSGTKASAKHALAELERHFATPEPGRRTTVVLVDELDQMITRRQEVIYNFFNWPHVAHSRLIVVAVANTMDLPERELSGKVRSRLGANRIPFPSYTFRDLQEILEGRLGGLTFSVPEVAAGPGTAASPAKAKKAADMAANPPAEVRMVELPVFDEKALVRIAKQVASVSGDARRALDIARRTVERVHQANQTRPGPPRQCTFQDAGEAYNAMTKYGPHEFVKQCSLQQKVLLLAVAQCARKSGVSEVEAEVAMAWHLDFLRQTGLSPVPSHDDLFTFLADLHGLRLVATESQRGDYFQRCRGLVEEGDLFGWLREDPVLKTHIPKI